MTKSAIDEGFPKYHMPLEEAHKLIETNMHLPESDSMEMPLLTTQPPLFTSSSPKSRTNSSRGRLGRIMHRLYDMEPANAPDKTLKLDLDIDLYQMEGY